MIDRKSRTGEGVGSELAQGGEQDVRRAVEAASKAFEEALARTGTEAPFGGYKRSGFGREMGMHAVNLYTEVKNVYFSEA